MLDCTQGSRVRSLTPPFCLMRLVAVTRLHYDLSCWWEVKHKLIIGHFIRSTLFAKTKMIFSKKKEIRHNLETVVCGLSIYTMDHPKFIFQTRR